MSELVRLRGKIYFTKYILCSGKKKVQYIEYKTMCKLVILVGLSLNTMGTGQWSCISLLWLWLISQADYNRPKQQC